MKILLPILSSFLAAVPPVGFLVKSQNDPKIKDISNESEDINLINYNDLSIDITSVWITSVEKFLKDNPKENEIFKTNFIQSLSLLNGEIVINLDTMSVYKNYDFYNFLANKDFLKMLNQSFAEGFIKYENNVFVFQEKLNTYIDGVWTEGYWYWFGYWRVHFSHWKVQELVSTFRTVRDVGGAIGVITKVLPGIGSVIGTGISVIATFLWSQFERLNDYDYGNGSWFGVYIIAPFAGFGSN